MSRAPAVERRSGLGHHPETAETPNVTAAVVAASLPRPQDARVPSSVSPWWWSGTVRAVEMAARTGSPFDLTLLSAFGVPEPDHPAHGGCVVSACAARNVIAPTGTAVLAVHRDGRLAPLRQWRGTEDFRARLDGGRG